MHPAGVDVGVAGTGCGTTTKEIDMTTQPDHPLATPRPGNPDDSPTDPDTEGNPVTPPNPAEAPPQR